jgi:Fur family peroxide stress response transcriptional regulator
MVLQITNKEKKLEQLKKICRQQGIPLTVQRWVVLEALADRRDHPTADQIFEAARNKIPGISRTTVYRILKTLVRMGMARKLSHPGGIVRIDPNTERHHHLVCLRCDRIIDFDPPAPDQISLPEAYTVDFEVLDYSILFSGICSHCHPGGVKLPPRKRKKSTK